MKAKLYKLTETGKILVSESDYPKTFKELKEGDYLIKSIFDLMNRLNKLNKAINPKFKIEKSLAPYINLIDNIKAFESNPILKHKKRIEKALKEIEKEKEIFENNYFFREYEKEHKAEIQALKKQLKVKKKEVLEKAKEILYQAYKTPKKQEPKPTKPLSLKQNFDDFNGQINIIYSETQTLFTSTLNQWKQLFSDDIQIFKSPIELKPNTTLSDLRLFLDMLRQKGLIKNSKFNKLLHTVKAFAFNGSIITAKQYKDAKQIQNYPNTLNSNNIIDVFNALNVD